MFKPSTVVGSICSTSSIALCAALLACAGSASAASAGACDALRAPRDSFSMQVPFEVIDGRIYVQAEVNGRGPFRFAVDTGASGMGRADASLVSALGLELAKPTLNQDGVKTAEADTTHLATLDIGGLVRRDLDVITRDYNSRMATEAAFSGIVAREFFGDGLLVIDYPHKTLSFSQALALSPGQAGTLAYERPFRVPVSIGARQAQGNLDTGANVAFVLPKALFDEVSDAPLQQAGQGQLANSQIDTHRATVHGPFKIGEASLSDQEVKVSDKYPELLVGAHALQHFVVLIDQRSQRVALCQ